MLFRCCVGARIHLHALSWEACNKNSYNGRDKRDVCYSSLSGGVILTWLLGLALGCQVDEATVVLAAIVCCRCLIIHSWSRSRLEPAKTAVVEIVIVWHSSELILRCRLRRSCIESRRLHAIEHACLRSVAEACGLRGRAEDVVWIGLLWLLWLLVCCVELRLPLVLILHLTWLRELIALTVHHIV